MGIPDGCRVRLLDLPFGTKGLLVIDEEDFANIYLNARLSREEQVEALKHELQHFLRGDADSDEDIRKIEE